MNILKIRNIKYFILLLFLYITFLISIKIINFYSLLFLLILLIIFYSKNKVLFKKILYKLIYKSKKNRLTFRDKYSAAKTSLESIAQINNKIKDKIKVELLNYERLKLESQLKSGDYNVTLFGACSSGKTSIARNLLKCIIGKTSPTFGTTQEITSYKIRIPILRRNINIIDTPGLFEATEKGKNLEKQTILQATNSDLVLFVLDQDINKYENYLINELSNIGKKIILVLNKCDLRTKGENEIILENIKNITSSISNNISIVKTIAAKPYISNKNLETLEIFPEVSYLFAEIIDILDKNGEELLADNILFSSNKLGIKSKQFISEERYLKAKKVINKYMWITVSVILVNPIPAVDLLTTTTVNVQMIIEISKIFEVKITKKEAKELSKSLVIALAKLGIVKGGLTIISSALASSYTTVFISKSIQSITAGWLIKIVGYSLIEYFKNGQDWGDGGIQEVVENIYKINKRDKVLNNFIKEAISKIKIKKNQRSQKKLPPFFN